MKRKELKKKNESTMHPHNFKIEFYFFFIFFLTSMTSEN